MFAIEQERRFLNKYGYVPMIKRDPKPTIVFNTECGCL